MKKIYFLLLCVSNVFYAQDGVLDTSFNPGLGAGGVGQAGFITQIVSCNNDKLYIRGGFAHYYNQNSAVNGLARINPNGSLDTSFDAGTSIASSGGQSAVIYDMTINSQNNLLIAGDFTSYRGITRNRIALLKENGQIDESFNPQNGPDKRITSVAYQADGKILIGGFFTTYNGTARNRIARLNSDGTLDTTFNANNVVNFKAENITILPYGKILVATWNSQNQDVILRLNTDGSLDTSFTVNTFTSEANSYNIQAIALQNNGKILVSGGFTKCNNIYKSFIARLNSDGSLDDTFTLPFYYLNKNIHSIIPLSDDKIFIAGDFTQNKRFLARLYSNGTIDGNFEPGESANDYINGIALQSSGKIVFGGHFTKYRGVTRYGIARVINTVQTLTVNENFNKNQLQIYPNPVGNLLHIQTNNKLLKAEIYSTNGQLVKTFSSQETHVADLPKGNYILKITTDKGIQTEKFIKE